jgi:hypothetical protein
MASTSYHISKSSPQAPPKKFGEANRAVVGTVAEVHNRVDSARPHEILDGHAVEHCGCVVPDGALGAFGFAEHVVVIGGRELYTDAHSSAHLTGRGSLKERARFKIKDMGDLS